MQITPTVHALRLPFTVPVAPGVTLDRFVNVFMIFGDTISLIDTGVAGCESAIFDYIRSNGRDPADLALIIQTHSHPDHIGATKAIQAATGCAVAAHPAERAWIEDVELQNRERPVPGFATLVGGSVRVDYELTDGETIDPDGTGRNELLVLHTPGHSKGSISLVLQGERVLFTGDAVPVMGDMPVYDDVFESMRSIKRLRALKEINILLSAWDEPRKGEEAYRQMDRALEYIRTIHKAVAATSREDTGDLMDLTRKVATALKLPPGMINPLLARTFAANLRVKSEELPDY